MYLIPFLFQHDSGSSCTPYSASPSDANGNFIMFASATSGDRPNNSQFSPCSKDNITAVLDKVVSQKNGKVFSLLEYFYYYFVFLNVLFLTFSIQVII